MIMITSRTVLTIIFLLLATCMTLGTVVSLSAEGKIVPYAPSIIELSGTVQMERHYGPPSYGENPQTDSTLNIPVLLLDHPVSTIGNPNDPANNKSFKDISKIQLTGSKIVSSELNPNLHVLVTGMLFMRQTAEQFTDVEMVVKSIKVLN